MTQATNRLIKPEMSQPGHHQLSSSIQVMIRTRPAPILYAAFILPLGPDGI